jgi:predicted DCC family thiol-disulfide oxidoreductase YuxK
MARSGGNPAELTSFYVVADYQTAASRVFSRSDAALFVAGALGWPWRAAQLIRFVPQAIRDGAYDVVARSRYRVFGRYDRCLVPSPEFRPRFIDS